MKTIIEKIGEYYAQYNRAMRKIHVVIGKTLAERQADKKNKAQTTWVYCKNCNHEMIADKESFVRDIYIDSRNIVHFKCINCKTDNYYDFDFPAPISLPLYDGDELISVYEARFKGQPNS